MTRRAARPARRRSSPRRGASVEVARRRRAARGAARARRGAAPRRRGASRARCATSPAPRVIAECKRRSPSRGILRARLRPAAHAAAYAAAGAAAISVLTEPTFFDGALEHLAAGARRGRRCRCCARTSSSREYQLLEAAALGADAVLLIVGALDDADAASAAARRGRRARARGARRSARRRRSSRAPSTPAPTIVGVNSRNLRTLTRRSARARRASRRRCRPTSIAVAESGIRTRDDIDRLAARRLHAFLVGERLITQPDPGGAAALRAGCAAP